MLNKTVKSPAGKKPAPVAPPGAQERILTSARTEFVDKGFAGARMQAIARGAGVNHALLHYYFGSKEKLYEATVRANIRMIWGGMQDELRNIPEGTAFEQLLSALLKAHAKVLSRHPEFVLFLLRELREGKGIPVGISEIFQSFGDVPRRISAALAAEIAAGRLRPVAPIHFWLNLGGMTISAFVASQFVKHAGSSPLPRPDFTEEFFLERAEVIAATLVRSLRPDKEMS